MMLHHVTISQGVPPRPFQGSLIPSYLLLLIALVGGCAPAGPQLVLELLPATSAGRVEAAIFLPARAELDLEWSTQSGEWSLKEGTLEVWLHQDDSVGELVKTIPFDGGSREAIVAKVALPSRRGGPVLLRVTTGAIPVEWKLARLRGHSSAENAKEWLVKPRLGAPDVIVYLIDTLRADVLGINGGPVPSPTFERLAAAGTLFERTYSTASWTRPAVASLFSGLTPTAHATQTEAFSLPDEAMTLAERYRLLGYQTIGVISNGHVTPAFNFDQGFEIYTSAPTPPPPADSMAPDAVLGNSSAEQVHDMVFRHLHRLRDSSRPLFLYVHTVDPHSPYEPPEWILPGRKPALNVNEYLLRQIGEVDKPSGVVLRDLALKYRGAVAYTDRELGRFLDRFIALTGDRPTYTVVTSDHGEAFYEHRKVGHRHWVHEELVRVPLVITGPGVRQGTRDARLASLIDILPTLLVQTEGSDRTPEFTEGVDLFKPGDRPTRGVTMEHVGGMAMVLGEWKLTDHSTAPSGRRLNLYNLRLDPLERTDLAMQRQSVARMLRARFRDSASRAESLAVEPLPVVRGTVPQEVIDNLRALGYLR